MSPTSTPTVVELDGSSVRIARIESTRRARRVRTVVEATRPADVDPADARAVGRWLLDVIRGEGAEGLRASGRVTFALPRSEAMLKRFDVRVPTDASPSDVDGAVRMQLTRQLASSIETGRVDYRVLRDTPGEDGTRELSVIAGALPIDRLGYLADVAGAAGLKIGRVTLRAFGVACEVSRDPSLCDGAVIAIGLGPSSSEILLFEDGALLACRGIDVAAPGPDDDPESIGQRLAVEVKRTWASYRSGPESREISSVVVVGEDDVCGSVARDAAAPLGVEGRALGMPGELALDSRVSECHRAGAIGLAGLVLSDAARIALDFEHPTQPPPKGQRARQAVLLGVLGVIVLGGGGAMVAEQRLDRLRDHVTDARQRRDDLGAEYLEFLTDRARGLHLRAWLTGRPDWLDQASWLTGRIPEPPLALLDKLGAQDSGGVVFIAGEGQEADAYLKGRWSRRLQIAWSFSGRVRDAKTLAALREALLASDRVRVTTRGPDAGERFDITITTASPTLGIDDDESDRPSSPVGSRATRNDSGLEPRS